MNGPLLQYVPLVVSVTLLVLFVSFMGRVLALLREIRDELRKRNESQKPPVSLYGKG